MLIAGMTLQAWVEIRSRELQTKEKYRGAKKGEALGDGGKRGAGEPEERRRETTVEPIEGEEAEVEEIGEVEVPLVRKKETSKSQ